jgi:uncharacterized protein (UPF0218 family)
MQLSSEELSILKRPMGVLINDSDINLHTLKYHLNNALMIVSVGDASTDRLINLGIVPHIQIVDGRERRISRRYAGDHYVSELRCTNPAGNITYEAISTFKEALSAKKPVRILVDGEEDLMALVALAYSQDNTAIVYGQPLEGIVIVTVNDETKNKYKDLISKIYNCMPDK